MTGNEAKALLDVVLAQVGEHFDAVQIHASWVWDDGSGGTSCVHRGTGNFYARESMAREYVEQNKARDSAEFIAQEMKKEDE